MRVVFLGTPLFARGIVEGIATSHEIVAVMTQPDKPFGRKKILKAPEVKEYAIEHNIPCYQPHKSAEIAPILHELEQQKGFDVIVVVAYGRILVKEIVERYYCVNLHGSLLPHYRGASPVQTSIMNDYKHFGLSVIHIDEGLDSGDILARQPIEPHCVAHKDLAAVFETLVPYGVNLLNEVLHKIHTKTLQPIPQEHDRASYCPKLTKQDSYLDFKDSYQCYLNFLALGSIGVWTYYQDMVLKINAIRSAETEGEHDQVGIILALENGAACISCQRGALWIESVTPQNKAKMPITSFLQSQKLKVGDVMGIALVQS